MRFIDTVYCTWRELGSLHITKCLEIAVLNEHVFIRGQRFLTLTQLFVLVTCEGRSVSEMNYCSLDSAFTKMQTLQIMKVVYALHFFKCMQSLNLLCIYIICT